MENSMDFINRMDIIYYFIAIILLVHAIWKEYKYRNFKKMYSKKSLLILNCKDGFLKKIFLPGIYVLFMAMIIFTEGLNDNVLLILILTSGFITQLFFDPKIYFTEEGIINLKQYSFIPWVSVKGYKKSDDFNDLIELKYIEDFREVKVKSEFEEEHIEEVLNVMKEKLGGEF
ncbi:hypothetical protein [Clostridium oceanicum]|uniref:DUF5673 domain-containing protein n=1 Tax=Clostridium oceanicum TaxID=1543 RepID=A0ABP3UMX4_9CLOT